MVGRGARNLILLSRSGPKNDNAISLLKELNAVGARIEAPVCDVTKSDSVSSVLMQCGHTMPPIKGCIQASLVVKVIAHILLPRMFFSH